LTKIIVFLQKS